MGRKDSKCPTHHNTLVAKIVRVVDTEAPKRTEADKVFGDMENTLNQMFGKFPPS